MGNDSNNKHESILPKDWRPERFATLIYLIRDDKILLIEKLRGHGAGKVNAPGGHIEVGESPEECAIREAFEEVGITVLNADLRATLKFHDTENGFNMLGYALVSTTFTGQPRSTSEAVPFWSKIDEIPFDRMWEDDQHWVPRILAGERLDCEFIFVNDILQTFRIDRI
ncbi:MAG: 8-oxo-dGTP diphosphatase [Gammaproteobacteria bacterium]|nr:8-oxo-dGTP diphosphatase [Gammaproteobacteria bacterium]